MKLFFWRKEPVENNGAYAPYEEIDAKRTSKLGYFFLILMVIFGVWQGNNLLSSIQDTIDRPEPNTRCTNQLASYANLDSQYTNSYYYYENNNTPCQYTQREIDLDLPAIYAKIEPSLIQLTGLNSQISDLEQTINNTEYQRRNNINEYQAALVEDIATSKLATSSEVLNTYSVGSSVQSMSDQLSKLKAELQIRTVERDNVEQKIRTYAISQSVTVIEAENKYATEIRVYELMVFLVSVILIAPLFYFSWRKYNYSRTTRSEYAIIWGGIVATFGLMMAQIMLVFIYEILPHQLLQFLFDFLSTFAILWTLLYWLGFILVPAFFGFLIYLIQKKFYNQQAVTMRALKNGHCPHCSLKVLPTMNNCPICGYNLKTRCASCNNMSTSGGSFCEICGANRQTRPTTNSITPNNI